LEPCAGLRSARVAGSVVRGPGSGESGRGASTCGLVLGLVLWIPRPNVEAGNDPAKQAKAWALAPALRVAVAPVQPRLFEDATKASSEQQTEHREPQGSPHHPRHDAILRWRSQNEEAPNFQRGRGPLRVAGRGVIARLCLGRMAALPLIGELHSGIGAARRVVRPSSPHPCSACWGEEVRNDRFG
jgi:hypothetical protein